MSTPFPVSSEVQVVPNFEPQPLSTQHSVIAQQPFGVQQPLLSANSINLPMMPDMPSLQSSIPEYPKMQVADRIENEKQMASPSMVPSTLRQGTKKRIRSIVI